MAPAWQSADTCESARMSGLLWGLLGALFIGVSDCVARITAQCVSISVLLAAVMGLSTVVLTGWMAITDTWPVWHAYGWGAAALSGLLNLVALALLYTALVRGPVSVASPAASSFSVILVLMNALAGEPLSWHQAGAIGLVFIGVAMLSRRGGTGDAFDASHLQTTAAYGLAAALVIAARMYLAQEAADALGSIPSLYLNRVFALAGVAVIFAFERARGVTQQWPDLSGAGLVLLQSVLETLALASFLIGSAHDGRIGATIGFATFSAITALTAWLWLGEPVGWRRSFWMGVIAAGIALAMMAQ